MTRRQRVRAVLAAIPITLTIATGCATGGGGELDAGRPDTGVSDAGARDAGRRDGGDASAPLDASTPFDASADAGTPEDAAVDAGTDAGWDAGMSICSPTAERLAIVEVMISSRSGSLDRGEWVELLNAGDCAIDLAGLVLAGTLAGGGTEATFTIPGGLLLPGARFVLAQSAVPAENHELDFDVAYTSSMITLDNGGDAIELRAGATVIDRVSWSATDFTHGFARSFPDGRPIADNASQLAWCNASAVYSTSTGGPYRGTPSMPNGACP